MATPATVSHTDAPTLGFFTRDEASAIEAAMARIFPDDDLGAGAVEAGALVYLDRALTGADLHLQGTYRQGIKQLNAAAADRHGKAFAACTPAEQDAMVDGLAKDTLFALGSSPTALALFEALRAHTIEGMFSDPVHGGNRDFAGWRLLGYPGPQPSYSHAEQQLDAVIVRDRIYSAADYPLPESRDTA
jgi:gluconate 2-dehydrogenase gamma chain